MTFIKDASGQWAAWARHSREYLAGPAFSSTAGRASLATISLVVLAVAGVIITHLYTHFRYRRQLSKLATDSPQRPPAIPYTVPFLGSALAFLEPKPELFWKYLFSFHPRSSGACTLLLGGQKTHILYDATAVSSLFKAKGPSRHKFNVQLFRNVFDCSMSDVDKLYGGEHEKFVNEKGNPVPTCHERQDEIWSTYLLKTDAVSELTTTFTNELSAFAAADPRLEDGATLEIGLFDWLRSHMFKASTKSLYGARIFEVYPELTEDFWGFDKAFLPLFFGLPRFMVRKEWEITSKARDGIAKWHASVYSEIDDPIDPKGPAWEPLLGSRVNRARHVFIRDREITGLAAASMDLAMLFGINSNAIPSACWMLMHIIDPNGDKTLLPRVMAELETAQNANGTLEISKLVALPLFQSVFQETLRLYTDNLVTRDLPQDLVLPMHGGSKSMMFEKGSIIMAPSFVGHKDPGLWNSPDAPCDVFYAERFLKQDPTTGKDAFTMTGTAGKFFPFGGGKTICPGRVFAKQEVMGAVAIVLLNYELGEPQFVDAAGKPTDQFPGLADGYGGGGVVSANGDVRVQLRRRSNKA